MEDSSLPAVIALSSHSEVTALLEKYGVKFAYVFGSQAKGKNSPQSEVDLKSRTENKLALVSRIGAPIKKDVDWGRARRRARQFSSRRNSSSWKSHF
jgi:predicted nucleotidyltransferase